MTMTSAVVTTTANAETEYTRKLSRKLEYDKSLKDMLCKIDICDTGHGDLFLTWNFVYAQKGQPQGI